MVWFDTLTVGAISAFDVTVICCQLLQLVPSLTRT